jgi:membrane associated rhomboid family serine protease
VTSTQQSYIGSSVVPFRLVFLMWLVFSIEFYSGYSFAFLGIAPRTGFGIIGIFLAPLIHGNVVHLLSNTFPLLFLGATLFFFYNRIGNVVLVRCYLFTNILVWLFSPRPSIHIGASGLVYGLAAFLIFFGFLRRDFTSLMISIAVMLTYGGIFYGILPSHPMVSWESHLAGAIVGTVNAFTLSDIRRVN